MNYTNQNISNQLVPLINMQSIEIKPHCLSQEECVLGLVQAKEGNHQRSVQSRHQRSVQESQEQPYES
jgi:hypothetical protein